ncbi:heavy metal translocating P-type ATPase [Kribbella jejuensis]|uniref:Cu2+-exporting ATPase n=1 Tax=Kribbella jejuensis TaxID=236068 RepID=A0A542ENW3_9ACTN|nr:Cu2+-exporting ATPase [Kribbella jejuensis]
MDEHEQHQHGGHDGHGGHGGHGDHAAQFKDRFWISLGLAVPVVFFSHMFADLLGYMPPEFPGSGLIAPVLGTVIFLYGGRPFLTGGWSELKSRQPGMMLLISMAITVAFVASWVTTLKLGGFDLDFWWELALLIVIMLLGHWLEMRALGAASGALDALAALLPDSAEKVTEDGVVEVALHELQAGDVVLVRSGGRVPADGTVVDGQAEVDESMITGESRPVSRGAGDQVVAGTVATDNALRVEITAVGDDTALAGIQQLVAEAQASSSRAQALADRAAAFLFYFASISGLITFVVWALLGKLDEAVTRTVTVLVIACPHALGLAIPLVIAISTERAAKTGVLVKNRLALERMRTVDAVLFDKTGTLTKGEPAVTGVAAVGSVSRDELLALAAAVEADSEHPLAKAIVRAHAAGADNGAEDAWRGAGAEPGVRAAGALHLRTAHVRTADVRTVDGGAGASDEVAGGNGRLVATEFRSLTGRGVQAVVDGSEVAVGGPAYLRENGFAEPDALEAEVAEWKARGAAVLHVVRDGEVLGAIALEDEVREESRQAVAALHQRGVKVAMITGDAHQVADAVARELGIDEVFAEVLPQDKDAKVAELQARGLKVAMVGDGVNDAPALARAEVGIAIGAGTDVAIESAGVVLAADDPRAVLSVIDLSKASYRKMWQNLVWATGYNVITVPLAAGVLAFAGVVVSPAAGALLMSISTIVVALNAQLLRSLDLSPTRLAA